MCWACDNPQATYQDYVGHLRSIVSRQGWAVQAVGRDRLRPPWAYTVGLTTFDLPELVVTGLRAVPAGDLLNMVASHALHAAMPEPGERVDLVGGPPIEIVRVQVPTAHLLMAAELFGDGIRALQVVHADDRGHWPWEPGYRGVQGGQPVLGDRARPTSAGSAG